MKLTIVQSGTRLEDSPHSSDHLPSGQMERSKADLTKCDHDIKEL